MQHPLPPSCAQLRLFDVATGQRLSEYSGHANASFKLGCCLSHDDSHVLGGSEDGRLHAWDLVEARQVARLQAHSGPISCLACDPKRPELLTASHDGAVKLWDAAKAAPSVGAAASAREAAAAAGPKSKRPRR